MFPALLSPLRVLSDGFGRGYLKLILDGLIQQVRGSFSFIWMEGCTRTERVLLGYIDNGRQAERDMESQSL